MRKTVGTISDAMFALPVPSNSTPNVHSLSLWKIFDRSFSIYSR